MSLGCSEISVSVIVKHVQHRIVRASCLPGGTYQVFQCLGGQKKYCFVVCLLDGISTHADTMETVWNNYLNDCFQQ